MEFSYELNSIKRTLFNLAVTSNESLGLNFWELKRF